MTHKKLSFCELVIMAVPDRPASLHYAGLGADHSKLKLWVGGRCGGEGVGDKFATLRQPYSSICGRGSTTGRGVTTTSGRGSLPPLEGYMAVSLAVFLLLY